MLRLEHVAVGYGRRVVLPDVHLALPRGSFTGLLGANGSGKSALIKTILGIIPPLSGGIRFGSLGGREPALGYTPQHDALDAIYLFSAFDVVLMGACGRTGPGRPISRVEKEWAYQCLRETGADPLRRKLFAELSGGQKQRVLIARALAAKPDLLLLDEPTSGIDAAARQAVMDVLRGIHERQELTILMASHDLSVVRNYVPDVIWLHQGGVRQGPARELLDPQKIEEFLDLDLR